MWIFHSLMDFSQAALLLDLPFQFVVLREAFLSVPFSYINYIFNIATKCIYIIEYKYEWVLISPQTDLFPDVVGRNR